MTVYLAPNTQLPWSSSQEDDSRFNRWLGIALGILLVLVIVVSLINVPEIPREEKERIPPQLARVMLEKQELPPPKPVEPPKEEKPAKPKPEEPKPEPAPEPKPEPKPIEMAPPPKTLEQAREKAQQSGLLQHQDELMAMRELLDTGSLASQPLSEGGTQAAATERSMPNSGRTTTSGGINAGELSTNTGTRGLAGRDTTQVTSELAEATQAAAGSGNAASGDAGRSRSEEEMSRVMDQHKSAIFQIYHRALRQNATLQGRVVMNIVIEPSGQISDVSIVTSELKDPELEAALIRRVRMIRFPADTGVTRTTLRQTFDFLPR